MNRRTLVTACVTLVITVPIVAACAVTVARVGDDARFVTWPVVAFTALAGAVALVGVLAGLRTPLLLAAGVVPGMLLSYFLPVAPLPVIAVVLVGLAALGVRARGVATGVTASAGALMVVFVVLQGPAVECHDRGVSTSSGPWWVDDASTSSGSGEVTADATQAVGLVQVGDRHYRYVCEGARLVRWERTTPDH